MKTPSPVWSGASWARLAGYVAVWAIWLYLMEWVIPVHETAVRDRLFGTSLILAVVIPILLYLVLPTSSGAGYIAEFAACNALLFLLPIFMPHLDMSGFYYMALVIIAIPVSAVGFAGAYFINRQRGNRV